MKLKNRIKKTDGNEVAAARHREIRPSASEAGGYGFPLERHVFFDSELEAELVRVWEKVKRYGLRSLSQDEKRLYEDVIDAEASRQRFDSEFFRNCIPETKRPGLEKLYHPGIRATPHGILIPAEIPLNEYREYHPQIKALRKKYFPAVEQLPRGRRKGSSYEMPLRLRLRIWKEFVRLVAGDDYARQSAGQNLEWLKDRRVKKNKNWTKTDRILAKKFTLPLWKIRLATRPE